MNLVFSTFTSRATSLLASNKVSVSFIIPVLSPVVSHHQLVMCPVQFQSHLIFLGISNGIYGRKVESSGGKISRSFKPFSI
jgi:hypothetical protein